MEEGGGKNISLPANRDRNEQGGGGKGQHEAKTAAEKKRCVFWPCHVRQKRKRSNARASFIPFSNLGDKVSVVNWCSDSGLHNWSLPYK